MYEDLVVEHVQVRGEYAPPSPSRFDLLLVLPVHTRHIYPALSYHRAVPADADGVELCSFCFTMHRYADDGGRGQCPPSAQPCPLCNQLHCANRLWYPSNGELQTQCPACETICQTDACAREHVRQCMYVRCEYCDQYYEKNDRARAKELKHYVLHCNVQTCDGCGAKYRLGGM